jgi:hypothetical protein
MRSAAGSLAGLGPPTCAWTWCWAPWRWRCGTGTHPQASCTRATMAASTLAWPSVDAAARPGSCLRGAPSATATTMRSLAHPYRRAPGRLRLHRGVLQPPSAPLGARLPQPCGRREEVVHPTHRRLTYPATVHESGPPSTYKNPPDITRGGPGSPGRSGSPPGRVLTLPARLLRTAEGRRTYSLPLVHHYAGARQPQL